MRRKGVARILHAGGDRLFQRISSGFGRLKFFEDGVGNLSDHEAWISSLKDGPVAAPQEIEIKWTDWRKNRLLGFTWREGVFLSPSAVSLNLPESCHLARFAFLEPQPWMKRSEDAVLILAGTGDHGYLFRTLNLAFPLLRAGVSVIILENAMYGKRKPVFQTGSKLRKVSDLLALGRVTIEESRSLLEFLRTQPNASGERALAVMGCSMGGLHAAMSASLMNHPIGVVAAFAPPNADVAFVKGIMNKTMSANILPYLNSVLSATDIRNFPRKSFPAVLVSGNSDLYVPSEHSVNTWRSHWPSIDVRFVNSGHLSGMVLSRHVIVSSAIEVLRAVATSTSSTVNHQQEDATLL
mmetsp:Transcript_29276/g.113528  ORF Transcript_29276/g.113528 Transcript_29276/m.113528 type:complete len:353 (-) Transcript_29276:2130-3188(-)